MKHNLTASARRFGGALKALAIAGAVSVALSAQAEYVSPGITINGSKPTSEGSFSGYTYYNGRFTLTSAETTYTFAGQDTSGKVRIVAAANCTIRLSDGFKLDLRKISGAKKNVWWMNAGTGGLRYLGEYDSKVMTFRMHKQGFGIEDGVLIAVDASKTYLEKEQLWIADRTLGGKTRDLNE